MRKFNVLFVVAALILSANCAWAQRGLGGGRAGGFGAGGVGMGPALLGQKSVQSELQLSAEQIKQVEEHLAKQRESLVGGRDLSREERQKRFAERTRANQELLASVLDENQLKRYRQIVLQQRGPLALSDPEVAQSLDFSDEQQARLREIQAAMRETTRGMFQPGADREEMRKKLEAARQETAEKLEGMLSAEQQAKWKEMIGEPFEGEIRVPTRRTRGGAAPRGGQDRPRRGRGNTDARILRPAAPDAPTLFTSFQEDAEGTDAEESDAEAEATEAKPPRRSRASAAKGRPAEAHRRGPARRGFDRRGVVRRPPGTHPRGWDRRRHVMARSPQHGPAFGAHRAWRPTGRDMARYVPRHGYSRHRHAYYRPFDRHRHYGPALAYHRGYHGPRGPMMARHQRGGYHHYAPTWRLGHYGHGRYLAHGRMDRGPRAGAFGPSPRGRMHMAGHRKHKGHDDAHAEKRPRGRQQAPDKAKDSRDSKKEKVRSKRQ